MKQIKGSYFLGGVLALYFIAGFSILPYYQYQINEDGVSYISIAYKYLNGHLPEAINGYWAPLFCWLLVPFLWLGLKSLVAAKVLLLLVGAITLNGARLLSRRFVMNESIRNGISLALVFPVLWWAYFTITPDLLLACLLIYYLYFLFDGHYCASPLNGLLCGAIGAVAYFSKNYAFMFFLLHFGVIHVAYLFQCRGREARRGIMRNYFLGMVVFLAISSLWVLAINHKYHQLTIGTGGQFNHALFGPEMKGAFPMLTEGLLKPTDPYAVSAWDDPSFMKVRDWSIFQSWAFFKFQVIRIFQNALEVIKLYSSVSVFSFFVILACSIMLFKSRIPKLPKEYLFPLLTISLYPAGYLMICVCERFVWMPMILIVLMGGVVLEKAAGRFRPGSFLWKIALIVYVISVAAFPAMKLHQNRDAGKDLYEMAQRLNKYQITGNVAVNKSNWYKGLYLSHHLGVTYYGQPMDDERGPGEQLREKGIDWYLCFGNEILVYEIGNYEKADVIADSGITLYRKTAITS